jgi:hypothetical protein
MKAKPIAAALILTLMMSVTVDSSTPDATGTSSQQQSIVISGEEINWQVVSSGGEHNGTSASYGLAGTVGQTAGGSGSSASYGLNHGFWQDFGGGSGPDYVCGDADASGEVDIDDVVYLIAYIFSGGPPPDPYESGDANCAGGVDIDDVVYLIAYIFSGGNAPCDTDGDGVPDC